MKGNQYAQLGFPDIERKGFPGRHEYKLVVNGNWYADTSCSEFTMNPHDSINSVMAVN